MQNMHIILQYMHAQNNWILLDEFQMYIFIQVIPADTQNRMNMEDMTKIRIDCTFSESIIHRKRTIELIITVHIHYVDYDYTYQQL